MGTAIGVGVGMGEALGVGAGVAATLKHTGCQSPVECVTVNAMTVARSIQVRPSRNPRWKKQGGWQVFEGEGVCPVFCGHNGRGQALSYARQRAATVSRRSRCWTKSGNVAETISNEDARPLVWRLQGFGA